MLGLIFHELSRYVTARLDAQAWTKLEVATLGSSKVYLATQSYPDAEFVKLATAAAAMVRKPLPAVLEDFGEFVAPSLIKMAGLSIDPKWKTLDLLEHTEGTMHKMIRRANPSANPAQLSAIRRDPKNLLLTYISERKLCPVAKGIIKGVAARYQERVTISENKCMASGAAACEMLVTVA